MYKLSDFLSCTGYFLQCIKDVINQSNIDISILERYTLYSNLANKNMNP